MALHKPGEPATCDFCGITPEAAKKVGLPAPMLDAGWLTCSCLGARPVKVSEEKLRRAEEKLSRLSTLEARACFYEEQRRPHKKGGGSGTKGRKKDPKGGKKFDLESKEPLRFDQGVDHEQSEKLEDLDAEVDVRLPYWLLEELDRWCRFNGIDRSKAFRAALVDWRKRKPPLRKYKPSKLAENRTRARFSLTQQEKVLFQGLAFKFGKFKESHKGTEARMAFKVLESWLR